MVAQEHTSCPFVEPGKGSCTQVPASSRHTPGCHKPQAGLLCFHPHEEESGECYTTHPDPSPCHHRPGRHRQAHTCTVLQAVVCTQGLGAQAPQPAGPSGQLGKEQTHANAEDLFSRHGVGFGQPNSTPHPGTCSAGAELLQDFIRQDGGSTETLSEAPGAYGCSCGDSPARSAPYETASALAPWPNQGVEMRYSPGSDYTNLPQNLQPVRSLVPSGRCAPGAGIQTCCGIHGCLGHRLGSHAQRARSIRGLDGSPTALAYQLPRVAGSTPCLEPPQRAPSAQGRSGPYGQHCDRCVYQPARRFTLPSHVATRPPPPPLESEFPSCHPHPRSVQSASRRAVLSSTEQAVQLIWGRFGAAQVDLFASPGVLLPNRGNARHGYTGTQLAPGPAQICLNDWRPVALTPILSKCFEKLVREHICSVLPASLDPLQFVYRSNRSTDDAIAFTLHTALSHLENKNTYVRMLFVDYSSAFNTIVPATLVAKLQTLGLNRSLCSWILDFLTGRSQVVRMGNNTSSPLILNTGAPQGCVLSPLLYSLYTHDCIATHSSNVIVKFADDTTVIGLITDNDETAYREEVSTLTKGCQENHLSLNIDKTKELVVDYRRQSREHTPFTIDKTPVERVSSFKFLGVHITEDLTWSAHTDAVLKKAHQRLFFLRRLRKFGTSPRVLRSFYTCTVESILTGCITAWFGNSTTGNRRALQRVVRTARHIVGGELPSLQDIYTRRCTRKARRIIKDSSHPSHPSALSAALSATFP